MIRMVQMYADLIVNHNFNLIPRIKKKKIKQKQISNIKVDLDTIQQMRRKQIRNFPFLQTLNL